MKKLILIFFLCSFSGFAQWHKIDYVDNFRFISVSVDPANAIYGSAKNSRGLDIVLKGGARHNGFQFAVFYERFDLIKYQSYGFQPSFVFKPFRNVQTLVGAEVSMIDRYGPAYAAYAINSEIEYHFKKYRWGSLVLDLDQVYAFWKADLKRRPDIAQDWGYSNYIGIGLKL